MKLSMLKLGVALTVVAASITGVQADDKNWRFASVSAEGTCLVDLFRSEVAGGIERVTNGAIKVDVFPGGQLGGEREALQGVQTGAIDISAASEGILGQFLPEWRFLNLPFLIDSPESWAKINALPSVQELYKKAEESGFYLFSVGYGGGRVFNLRNGLVEKPEDLKGMRIRTQENPIQIATVQAFGAEPEAIPLPELYSALQTRVVDAMYNDAAIFTSYKTYEVAPYVTDLPIFTSLITIMASKEKIDSLDPEMQVAVKEALNQASIKVGECALQASQEAIVELNEKQLLKGYNKIDDIAPFRDVVAGNYAKLLEGNEAALAIANEIVALGK